MSGIENLVTWGMGDGQTLVTVGFGGSGAPPPSQYGTISVTTSGLNGAIVLPVSGEVFVDSVSMGLAPWTGYSTVGNHVVSFGNVSGFTSPASVPVAVLLGGTHPVAGVYLALGSFPSSFIKCPRCDSPTGVRRVGSDGIPYIQLGKMHHREDPMRFRCENCGKSFKSKGITLSEAMGTRVE